MNWKPSLWERRQGVSDFWQCSRFEAEPPGWNLGDWGPDDQEPWSGDWEAIGWDSVDWK